MIDWMQVDELRADMGEDFAEVVQVFLQEVQEAMDRLDPRADAAALAADLHFLKGAALNLGFRNFAALCAMAEDRANAGQTDGFDLDAIAASYASSRTAFLDGLARRAA
ncbi:MAG: Hpt domain-containing protein [Rhodobacteraceae bacterium]|nr:Hpt domain-containing protein [Paracoccaceae bacterium]